MISLDVVGGISEGKAASRYFIIFVLIVIFSRKVDISLVNVPFKYSVAFDSFLSICWMDSLIFLVDSLNFHFFLGP